MTSPPSVSVCGQIGADESGGFSIIEQMVALAIFAIILGIGIPNFVPFIADQRVRVAISDIHHDLTSARADALSNARKIIIERTGATWKQGWRICVGDTNPPLTTDTCAPAPNEEILRVTQEFSGERLKVCVPNIADFADRIVFGPDGLMARTTPFVDGDFIRVSDDLGDSDAGNDKIRTIYFGALGRRISTIEQNGGSNGGAPCP